MYILLAALLVVLVLWLVLKPGWAPQPPDTSAWTGKARQASEQATTKARQASEQASIRARQASEQATAKAGQMYQGLRGRFKFRADTHELAKQFKVWVADATPQRDELYNTLPASADGFAIWLSGLADKDLERFTQRVARFCASLNFDLAWLNDPQVGHKPELKKAVEDAVLLYSLAAWRANNVQQDVTAFLAYQAWLGNPKRHKTFGQELHQALVQQGLVTVPAELYLAPERERLAQAMTAIRHIADENPTAFNAVLRQVVGVEPVATPASPAPVPAIAEPAEPAPSAEQQATA